MAVPHGPAGTQPLPASRLDVRHLIAQCRRRNAASEAAAWYDAVFCAKATSE